MTPLIILGVILVAVVIALGLFTQKSTPEEKVKNVYSYKRKDLLMSLAEHKFFDVLVEALGKQYHVFPQIHLDDILEHKIEGQNWKGAFRHIDEKSIDYVICDKVNIKPLLAIELDDRTHEREDRKVRDDEVKRILHEAGLPLLRFGNHGSFEREEIRRIVLEKLNNQ
jgi:very-short-patch-repair endonuclease